jgi:predicted DNA-binding antitoxin AbrB/MazE fold protein
MSEQVDAIYDNGVLKPLTPLALPDKARVKLTVDTPSESNSAEATVETAGADFDAELDPLLFDGPSLPPDFSRADIYADHD